MYVRDIFHYAELVGKSIWSKWLSIEHSWIGSPVDAHETLMFQLTKRATTNLRPCTESYQRGESSSFVTTYLCVIQCWHLFQNSFPKNARTKIVIKDLDLLVEWSTYSWIGHPVETHEQSIPRQTRRATYDNSKTTVGKLSARIIQIFRVHFCAIYSWPYFSK